MTRRLALPGHLVQEVVVELVVEADRSPTELRAFQTNADKGPKAIRQGSRGIERLHAAASPI
jgi:hypothetical protein